MSDSKHMPETEYVTPNSGPPFSVRRMTHGPTHIVARDGFTIIATVNHDKGGYAEKLAAAPQLLAALRASRGPIAADAASFSTHRKLLSLVDAAIAKAEGR